MIDQAMAQKGMLLIVKTRARALVPCLLSGLLFSACAESPRYTRSLPQVARTTSVRHSASYYQTGKATYYGNKFHGRKTASGERYDRRKLTAAHTALPFGTMVRVTNLDNGKKVTVRINDRGPLKNGRIIDLSRAAAEAIDMISAGVVRVGIEIVKE